MKCDEHKREDSYIGLMTSMINMKIHPDLEERFIHRAIYLDEII